MVSKDAFSLLMIVNKALSLMISNKGLTFKIVNDNFKNDNFQKTNLLDPVDLAPLRSCLVPIVTASASKDESEPEDGSVQTLETDLSSDDDRINTPGTEVRGSSLGNHVDHEDQALY